MAPNRNKSLEDKAISIKGKKYVLVAERILFFNETYPNGSIETALMSEPSSPQITIQAKITPDSTHPQRFFVGHSQAVVGQGYINETSALENAETSAVGRALAMMGIGVIESVASADEINKAVGSKPIPRVAPREKVAPEVIVFKKQIKDLCDNLNPLLESEQDYKQFVFARTALELTEKNYPSIIEKLSQ